LKIKLLVESPAGCDFQAAYLADALASWQRAQYFPGDVLDGLA